MRMIPKIALATLVAVVATASAASAGPPGASQRVAVESRGGVFAFAFLPLGVGSLKGDSGTTTWGEPARRTGPSRATHRGRRHCRPVRGSSR